MKLSHKNLVPPPMTTPTAATVWCPHRCTAASGRDALARRAIATYMYSYL
jgi:alcohol dehydrogenase class IV